MNVPLLSRFWVQECAHLDLALLNVLWLHAMPVQVSLIAGLLSPAAQALHNVTGTALLAPHICTTL